MILHNLSVQHLFGCYSFSQLQHATRALPTELRRIIVILHNLLRSIYSVVIPFPSCNMRLALCRLS